MALLRNIGRQSTKLTVKVSNRLKTRLSVIACLRTPQSENASKCPKLHASPQLGFYAAAPEAAIRLSPTRPATLSRTRNRSIETLLYEAFESYPGIACATPGRNSVAVQSVLGVFQQAPMVLSPWFLNDLSYSSARVGIAIRLRFDSRADYDGRVSGELFLLEPSCGFQATHLCCS